jgi:biotin transport system substrate-specific component
MALGTVIIYVCGAAWLSWSLNIPIATGNQNAIALGVTPFLLGDLVKMLLAALTTSASWNLVNRLRAE